MLNSPLYPTIYPWLASLQVLFYLTQSKEFIYQNPPTPVGCDKIYFLRD